MSEPTREYANEWIDVFVDEVADDRGRRWRQTRIVEAGGRQGVVVLPVHEHRIGLVEHDRYPVGRTMWEAPRGFGESNPVADAERELREETGLQAVALVEMGVVHPNSGLLASEVALFVAIVASPDPETPGDGEVRSLLWRSSPDVLDMIDAGQITDALTIAVVFRAHLRWARHASFPVES